MKHPVTRLAAALVLTAAVAAAARAQASTKDFAWLAGTWEGEMTGGVGIADVTFSTPKAGLITGTMRLVDPKGNVLVVELLTMVDTAGTVELRFRHFSAGLDAYETTFKQNMRLMTHAADRDVFENSVAYQKELMSTQPRKTQFIRHGSNEFVGHSDIIDGDGKPAVVEVTYHRKR